MKHSIQLKLLLAMVLLSLFSIMLTSWIIRYRVQFHFHQYAVQLDRSPAIDRGPLTPIRPMRYGWNRNQQVFLNEVSRSLYLGGFLTILTALGLSWLFARYMSRPMKTMLYATQHIAKGDYHHRIADTSDDEWKVLGQAFNHMAERLEETEQLRKELISNLSHELATPLTNLIGYLQAINDGLIQGSDKTHETTRLLLHESYRMKEMLEDLRDLSIVESDKFHLDYQLLKLEEIIGKIISSVDILAKNKNISIRIALDNPKLMFYADPVRLHQLLLNLLQNSIQYSKEDTSITIESKSIPKDGIQIIIQDEGIGIAEHDLPHIFERFYRADRSRCRESEGTGIGLAIAKKLAEAHGGKLEASSQVGKGTRMILSLPLNVMPAQGTTLSA
jgi:signal transduction histidine kinase